MRSDRYHLLPDILLILAGVAGWFLFSYMAAEDLFASAEQHLSSPIWFFVFLFLICGVSIGVFSLIFSVFFDAGKWWVQVLLILAGVGLCGLAQWWFWLDAGQPIIFHPGYLLWIVALGAGFSGVFSLVWGIFRRAPITRPRPAQRFRMCGAWLRKFWFIPTLIVLAVVIWVAVAS
ncbi:hypothetical protein [Corynebacterium crudilactis]|uniref:Uncharacterized protein n=1 Tax=Corynebacterium crudilactis TaxID=1652495 RepID=A0A172QR70_9CORY|nr:hypothetical protein [Corynebacterium crudilactis]ANE03172.1 hypothetical protein ccrud_02390 [Corynebacterium crudilactis]